MTINVTTSRIGYAGDNVSTVFNVPFLFFANGDLTVTKTTAAGAIATLVLNVDYTLTGAGVTSGGTLTKTTVLLTGETLQIILNPAITQLAHYVQNQPFPSATVEQGFDKLTQISQRLQDEIGRSLRAPDGDSSPSLLLPAAAARANTFPTFDSNGNISVATTLPGGTLSAASIGLLLNPQTPAEASASVTPSFYQYTARPVADLTRYGGKGKSANGNVLFDNTTAMNNAAASLNAQGGGIIKIPYPDEWGMNWTCLYNNITIEGPGGKGEFDTFCIRPFSLASAALTYGNGVTNIRYCRLVNVHVSGTDGVAQTAAHCAPQALLLTGGTIGFRADDSVFYTGIQTVSVQPSATNAVTGATFIGCIIRNDNTDSANSRAIYAKRLADPGFITDFKFIATKVNSVNLTAGAYAIEIDANVGNGVSLHMIDCYVDIKPALGLLLHQSSALFSFNTQFDPGTSGVVVLETTDTGRDITRYVIGELVVDGQQWKTAFGGGTVFSIPSGVQIYSFRQALSNPFLVTPVTVGSSIDVFAGSFTAATIDTDTATGPLTVNNADWSVKTAGKGLRVREGANAKQGTAVLVAGTLVVANTSVTATSRILLTSQVDGGTPGFLRVSTRSAGTSFTILSSNAADTSTVAYQIFEPA